MWVEGTRDKGRPCERWVDGVKEAYSAKSLELIVAKGIYIDRQQCRDFANGTNGDPSV